MSSDEELEEVKSHEMDSLWGPVRNVRNVRLDIAIHMSA